MSKDWTPEELQAASQMMKAAGHMRYEEFCEAMDNGYSSIVSPSAGGDDTVNHKESDIWAKRKSPHRSSQKAAGRGNTFYYF